MAQATLTNTSPLPFLPIYNNLVEALNAKISQGNFSIRAEYRNQIHQILNSSSLDHGEQISLLLIHYYFLSHLTPDGQIDLSTNPFVSGHNLPYGIKLSPSGEGFSFELDQLDPSFQALLGTYCNL